MSVKTQRVLIGVRCDGSERTLWQNAVAQLDSDLNNACEIAMVWIEELASAARSGCDILCLSMLPDLDGEWANIESAWRHAAGGLHGALENGTSVFIVTIVRCLKAEDRAVMPVLRRLNLLAARLSQQHGMYVIDLDRRVAHLGGLNVGVDARLETTEARRVASELIVDALLQVAFEPLAGTPALEGAQQRSAARVSVHAAFAPSHSINRPLHRSSVKGGPQTSVAASHDLYGGIHDLLQDLRAPRPGVRWRLPLVRELWYMVWRRLSGRLPRLRL